VNAYSTKPMAVMSTYQVCRVNCRGSGALEYDRSKIAAPVTSNKTDRQSGKKPASGERRVPKGRRDASKIANPAARTRALPLRRSGREESLLIRASKLYFMLVCVRPAQWDRRGWSCI